MTRWWKAASILLAAGATAGSVLSFAQEKPAVVSPQPEANAKAARGRDTPVVEVKPADLPVTVMERGSLESSANLDVFCKVEGQTTIIMMLPEGKQVKKGDVVCELDSAALKDQLVNQEITAMGAKAAWQNAGLRREVAEIALKEYRDGLYLQNKATIQGELKLAESDVAPAENEVGRMTRARQGLNATLAAKRGDRTAVEIAAEIYIDDRVREAQVAVQRVRSRIEQFKAKGEMLEKYEAPKRIKELQGEVEKARSDELAKKATWDREMTLEKKLRTQIENCTIKAPGDGIVVYANDPNRFGDQQQPQIGAAVRERQKIFRIPDLGAPWQVNAKIHVSNIDRVTPGQRVRVRVLGFPEETLGGTVRDVAPLPDPSTFFSDDVKVYTAHMAIDKPLPGLRPGMTAQVEILVIQLSNVLSVPIQAVLELNGKYYVYVVTPGGPERREVRFGVSNDTMVEVKEGLRDGDKVALNPIAVMPEAELREAFAALKEARAREEEARARKEGVDRAKAQAKTKTQRGAGMPPALKAKMQNIAPEDRRALFMGPLEERKAILRKAGFTDDEIKQLDQMRQQIAPAGGPGSSPRGGATPR
jgi:RND family efflux transporter MFP subunit